MLIKIGKEYVIQGMKDTIDQQMYFTCGDASKANDELGWTPKTSLNRWFLKW